MLLHLSAHTANGAIGLTVDGSIRWIDQEDHRRILTHAPSPRLTVLNICSSHTLANSLINWCPTVLYWPNDIGDNQLRQFSNSLYRSLALGLTTAVTTASIWRASGPTEPVVLGTRISNL